MNIAVAKTLRQYQVAWLLDKAAFAKLDSDSTAVVINKMRMCPLEKQIVEVKNASDFLNKSVLLAALTNGILDTKTDILLEHFEVCLTDKERAAILNSAAIRKSIELREEEDDAPNKGENYPFQTVPKTWTIEKGLRRKSEGKTYLWNDKRGYSVSEAQLKRLWLYASPVWADPKKARKTKQMTFYGISRTCLVRNDRLDVGCQTIRRYKLEQLAKHLNWPFP